MDILDFLLLDPFKHDYLDSMICLCGEDEVYAAIAMGIVIEEGVEIKINLQ